MKGENMKEIMKGDYVWHESREGSSIPCEVVKIRGHLALIESGMEWGTRWVRRENLIRQGEEI